MYQVLRTIHFSYGHRLHNHPGKCARLHGHNAKVIVEISSVNLNEQKMVMDFYEIRKILETWIDEHLDHRMILAKNDPIASRLQEADPHTILIDENPTAEVLAQWIFKEAKKQGLPVTKITFWETDDSAATYTDQRP